MMVQPAKNSPSRYGNAFVFISNLGDMNLRNECGDGPNIAQNDPQLKIRDSTCCQLLADEL